MNLAWNCGYVSNWPCRIYTKNLSKVQRLFYYKMLDKFMFSINTISCFLFIDGMIWTENRISLAMFFFLFILIIYHPHRKISMDGKMDGCNIGGWVDGWK